MQTRYRLSLSAALSPARIHAWLDDMPELSASGTAVGTGGAGVGGSSVADDGTPLTPRKVKLPPLASLSSTPRSTVTDDAHSDGFGAAASVDGGEGGSLAVHEIELPVTDDVDFELFVRSVDGEDVLARVVNARLTCERTVHLLCINVADWGGDVRDRVVTALNTIFRSASRAKVRVLRS
jgi:hypothetical protein